MGREVIELSCTCLQAIYAPRVSVNASGAIPQRTITNFNRHVRAFRDEAKVWLEDEVVPVKVAEAKSARVTYEGWVFHEQDMPDAVMKNLSNGHWNLHLLANQSPSYPWISGYKNTKGWSLRRHRTQEGAIAVVSEWFVKFENQGKELTWFQSIANLGVKALSPTVKEAVATLIKKAGSETNIAKIKYLLDETDEAEAALGLLRQRLRQELKNQFSLL